MLAETVRLDMRTRSEHIPLYYWIQNYGSINNVKEDSFVRHRLIGWHFADDVLKRFVRLYKPTPSLFDDIIYKAVRKYGTQLQHMPIYYRWYKDSKGKPVPFPYKRVRRPMIVFKNEYGIEEVRVK